MRQLIAAVAVLFAVDVYAYSKSQDFRPATQAEKELASVASAPGAPAAILDWVRVDDDTASLSSEYIRIKIFSDEGKKYGDVELAYLPGYPLYGRITAIDARTIRPDGTIAPFDGKIYDKVVFKAGRSAVKAKTFSLPDVQPGSIIEYRFTRRWSEQMLLNTSWSVQYDIPLLHAKLTLRPYDSNGEYASFFSYFGLPSGKAPVRVNESYELELENIPPFRNEPFSPPEQQLKAWVNFYYTSSRVKPDEFWSYESQNWSKRIEDFLAKAGDAKTTVMTLYGSAPVETAKKIYAHVQKFRNYSFEVEKTDQEIRKESISAARNANDVLRKSAGTSEEINRAFVALARAAGLKADVVRVAPRDTFFFSQALPNGDQMSAEVALLNIDGTLTVLDPGTPHAPFGVVSWEKSSVPGIHVTKGAAPQWVTIPQAPPEAAMTKRAAELKLSGDALEGTVTATFTGQEALVRRLRHLSDDDAARKKALEEEAKGWFADGASVKLTNLAGAASFDEPLVATFSVTLPNLVSAAGSRTVLPLSIFAANATNPFAPATRTNAIYFEYPRTEEDSVKVTLPEELQVSAVPPPSNLKAGAVGYRSEAKAEGNAVTFTRSMFVNAMLIDAKHYTPLRTFYSSVIAADQKPLVLVAKE